MLILIVMYNLLLFQNDIQYMYRYVHTESAQYPGQISRKNNIGM